MTKLARNALAIAAIVLGAAAGAADLEEGRRLYAQCALCHGANGEGHAAMRAPPLAARESWYIERQLELFRNGLRGVDEADIYGRQMAAASLTLWDQREARAVAAFTAALPAAAQERTVRGKAARGAKLYESCAGCHGAAAEGTAELGAPQLSGLPDWYVVAQLQLYRAGARGTAATDTPGQTMRSAAAALPNEQALNDVAAYLSALD